MEKKIIVDKSIQLDALKALEDELDSLETADEKVGSFLDDKLSEINKKVDAICSSVDSMKESHISKREVVDMLKGFRSEVDSVIRQESALTHRGIDSLREQLGKLQKAIEASNSNYERFDQQIDSLSKKMDSMNIERAQSQSSIKKYTDNTAKCVATFVQANKSVYSQLGETTKKLLKGIISAAEQVKKTGTEIGSGVRNIVEKTVVESRRASYETPVRNRTSYNRAPAGRASAPITRSSGPAMSDNGSEIWKYAIKFRFGHRNKYQRAMIIGLLPLIFLFVVSSFFLIDTRYAQTGLGAMKFLGITWKVCVSLITLLAYLLTLLMVIRGLATAALVVTGKLSLEKLAQKPVIMSVLSIFAAIIVCRYFINYFSDPGEYFIGWKDILLAQDPSDIQYGIREVFENWRLY